MKTAIKKWNGKNIVQCAEALADKPYTVFLDSNRPSHPDNKFSILCWNPKNIFKGNDNNLYDQLDDFLAQQKNDGIETHLPFYGGLIGYLSYEYGVQNNGITPAYQSDLPAYLFCHYTCGIVYDHAADEHYFFYEDQKDIEALKNALDTHTPKPYAPNAVSWQSNNSDTSYKESVQTIIDLINQGEVYQVNLTRQFTTPKPENFNSYAHYKILRDTNPAPFSAFMNFDDFQVLSCSPERFLKIQDDQIESKPIKGTLPDTLPADVLLNSAKDRAENTMIVDLLRNDLSKVCKNHSITVPKLCQIESFEGLHHLVSTIRGVLDTNKTPLDVLQSSFPGGSITGAPKIAAITHINALEDAARGIYCGSIGYIGLNGAMDMNIVIRTMIATQDQLILNTGSGIVSDSDPQKELEETYNKIKKIFDSFDQQKKEKSA